MTIKPKSDREFRLINWSIIFYGERGVKLIFYVKTMITNIYFFSVFDACVNGPFFLSGLYFNSSRFNS